MDVVIQIEGPQNESLRFAPIRETVRGTFDARRTNYPELFKQWPEPIPGQQIGLDIKGGKGFIIEPLRLPQNAELLKKCEQLGEVAEAERELPADSATWLFWMKKAVEAGLAHTVKGHIPVDLSKIGTPQTSFITAQQPEPIERLCDLFEKLLAKQA